MNVMARLPLVIGLALARTERAATPPRQQVARAVVATTKHGTVVAENGDGLVYLVLASDAVILGVDGPLGLEDIGEGDVLRWEGEDHQRISMVEELWVTRGVAERAR
jgi:hypothetical protein